jgi:hypothetical protein
VVPSGDLVELFRGNNPVGARDMSCVRLERIVPSELRVAFTDSSDSDSVNYVGYTLKAVEHLLQEAPRVDASTRSFVSLVLIPILQGLTSVKLANDTRVSIVNNLEQLDLVNNNHRSILQSPRVYPFPFKDIVDESLFYGISCMSPTLEILTSVDALF